MTNGVDEASLNVTIKQLLSHHGGMLSDISKVNDWDNYFTDNSNIMVQRIKMTADILRQSNERVGKFSYSNAGVVVAGTMLEQLTDQTWEDLIVTEVLVPLSIHDAGFGAPYSGFEYSQPYGHFYQNNQYSAREPSEKYADNPAAIGPAGTMHMSLNSLIKYAQLHIDGANGASQFLTQENFKVLHQAVSGSEYSMGWFVNGDDRSHDGSNNLWFAKLGWNAKENLIAIAVTNAGGEAGNNVTDELINSLLKRNK